MEKVIIIGSGCAGLTAAIYCARARLEPIVFSGSQPGGQLTITSEVENFPGFPDGILGAELMAKMTQQAEKFGTRIQYDDVEKIQQSDDGSFIVKTLSKNDYKALAIIVATGASARHLGIENEMSFIGKGLTSCATCDGAFYRNVPVCVIGGGDSACEESVFLTKFASKVYLIHRRDELRASKIMANRALNNPKIEVIWDSIVTDYQADDDGKMCEVKLKNVKSGETSQLDIKCVFVAIGHIPNTKFLNGLVKLDENGYIRLLKNSMTNCAGIFAAGDACDYKYQQAITAASQGCMAAIDVENYLRNINE